MFGKKKKADQVEPYKVEEYRLRKMIAELDPLDENYDKLQEKLSRNIKMEGDSKENKRRISKSDRGGVIMKILSIAGAIGGGIMIGKFEKDGMTYTGEKRSIMDALSRTFGNMFLRKD